MRTEDRVEVAHEAIFRAWPKLRDWMRTSADILRWRRDVERDRPADGGPVVLSKTQLAIARSWPRTRREELTSDELKAIRSAVVRERVRYAAVALIVLAIAGLGVAAWLQKRAADRAAQASLGRSLASQSAVIRNTGSNKASQGLLLAIEGYRRDESSVAARELQTVLATTPPIVAQFKLPHPATAVRFGPGSQFIATGDSNGEVVMWDRAAKTARARTSAGRSVIGLWWRPDGEQIAILRQGVNSRELLLWDWKTNSPPVVGDSAEELEVMPTSGRAWLVTTGKKAREWVPPKVREWLPDGTSRVLLIPIEHVNYVLVPAETSEWIAVSSFDGVWVVETATGKVLTPKPLAARVRDKTALAFTPHGVAVLVKGVGSDGSILVWDWSSGEEHTVVSCDKYPGYEFSFAAASHWIADETEEDYDKSRFCILDAKGRVVHSISLARREGLRRFIFRDHRLIAALGDGLIRVFDLNDDKRSVRPALQFGPESSISAVDLDDDGSQAAVASADGSVTIWELRQGFLQGFGVSAKAAPSGDAFALIATDRARIVRFGSGETIVDLGAGLGVPEAFSVDGQRFAAEREVEGGPGVIVTDVKAGTTPRLFTTGSERALDLAFSKNGDRLMAIKTDYTVVSFDVNSGVGKTLLRIPEPDSVQLSPDGRFLAMKNSRGPVVLRSLDGTSRSRAIPSRATWGDLQFSSDGQYLAAFADDRTGGIWRVDTLKEVSRFSVDITDPYLHFDPSGRYLVLSGEMKQVTIIDVQSGGLVQRLGSVDDRVPSFAFSHDGAYVAVQNADNDVRIWRVTDGGLVTTIPQERQAAVLELTSDDRLLIVPYELGAGTLRVINWKRDAVIGEACRLAARKSLTRGEWAQFLPGEPYRETCPAQR